MKNILICPLDWGMGHATRVQQVAANLHGKGHNVTIAASEQLLALFDTSICSGKIVFSSTRVIYSSFIPQYLAIILQAPILILQYLSDHYRLGRIVKRHNIDIVISDNRFGAWTRKAYSVYITHQLTIKAPLIGGIAGKILSGIHRYFVSLYNECWVPDLDNQLTGDLSRHENRLENIYYVGVLSMLTLYNPVKPAGLDMEDFHAVIISGPEPQRTILESKIIRRLSSDTRSFVLAGGNLEINDKVSASKNIKIYNYLNPGEIRYILSKSKGVICRAGYSTIMDLVATGKSALLIPTPGQTEQEYLAQYLSEKKLFSRLKQSDIDSEKELIIPRDVNFGDIINDSSRALEEIVNGMISRSSSL